MRPWTPWDTFGGTEPDTRAGGIPHHIAEHLDLVVFRAGPGTFPGPGANAVR
ncbi:hypothetical protein ACFPIJ_61630 [Dactylosporangium cerinum]|uniref:Uncharacterized protein n=1 Tax=Dactylosporangium cerinum TaxID=1434730 RepID=A0ABV9WHK3_9ACTN